MSLPRPQTSTHGASDGFALIIAISLMGFVLLLLLTISTFVRVEQTNSQQSVQQLAARQNALLGLQVALGQTQLELGPDTRVSAMATIRDTDPRDRDDSSTGGGSLQTDGLDPDRQHWTGVWNSSVNTAGYVETSFRRWLVSGEELEVSPANPAHVDDSVTSIPDAVSLVGGNSATSVEAGRVGIQGVSDLTGHYAYWVGDEGAKAKINLTTDPGYSPELLPQQTGLAGLDSLDWLIGGSREAAARAVGLPTLQGLAQAAGESVPEAYFHSLGFHSFGLLANVREGGLKKDLTTALYDINGALTGAMFPPLGGGALTDKDPGGPDWAQLKSWIQLQPDSLTNEVPIQVPSSTQVGSSPILSAFQLYIIPTYDPDGSIRFNMMPAVVLWNPYDRPLASADYTVSLDKNYFRSTGSYAESEHGLRGWYYFQIKDDSGTPQMHKLDVAQGNSPPEMNEPIVFHLTSGTLEPGASVVYSPALGHTAYPFGDSNASVRLSARLERGFRPGASLYFYPKFQVPINPATETPPFEFRLWHDQGRVYAVKLNRGDDPATNPLQRIVYINTYTSSTYYTSFQPMEASPIGTTPLGTEFAVGQKVMHTFSNNDPFWTGSYPGEPYIYKWLSHYNPRGSLHGPLPLIYGDSRYLDFLATVPSYVSNYQTGHNLMQQGITLPGAGYSGSTIDRTVLFQVAPERAELHSIGQLAHAPLFPPASTLKTGIGNARFDNLIPAYAIGNSRAQPFIPLDATEVDWLSAYTPPERTYEFDGVLHDYSYKLNEVLWDAYFFSTLSGTGTTAANFPANPRMVSVAGAGSAPRSDVDLAAADLMVDGSFNINSTSVDAWEAVLSGFFGVDIDTQLDGNIAADITNPKSPILRVDQPLYEAVDDADGSKAVELDRESYAGYRALSTQQLRALAESIVEEVKLRGPFGSMAHFINRMPNRDASGESSDDAFRLSGTLDAAIRKSGDLANSQPGINAGLQQEAALAADPSGIPGIDPEAEAGWRTEDLPGWLSSIDLLQRLGSVLSARSDTFRIRAYGESVNSVTGEVVTARCEAVIQRLPEYVDPAANSPEDAPSGVNQQFGRRFVIVDFHWLEDAEI